MDKNKKVEVCDKCLKASCWYGEFMCQDAKGAGTKLMTIEQLENLNLESSHYWSDECMTKVYGEPDPFTNLRKCPYYGHIKYDCNQYPNAEKYCIWVDKEHDCEECYCSEEGDCC